MTTEILTPEPTTPGPTAPAGPGNAAHPEHAAHGHRQSRRSRIAHFVGHYVEMVVAMFAGMYVLGAAQHLIWPDAKVPIEVGVLIMATNMSIGMALWMWFRGHSWRGIAEMSASMYLPFVVLLVPFWAGAIDEHTLMTWGHLLMLPAMAIVMLLRPAEYSH
ncbi:hypothetical protein [Blastococcus deserti]|uniref:Flagellar biosynthetic protein FliP n=1 Tax=Blastococcus deserti TaxID=2259033 RepID=A0ABW4XDH7_9ACTN